LIVGDIIVNLRAMITNMTHLLSPSGMKPAIILVLLSSMLLQSCYSYYAVTDEEQQRIAGSGEDQIQIPLADGQEVIVDPYHYVRITEPIDGIYAVGELLRGTAAAHGEPFHGVIQPVRIDSSEVVVKRLFMLETKATYYDMWLPDSSRVKCTKDDMIHISKEQGAGLWVNGYIVTKAFLGAKETKAYIGKVPETDAKNFEQKKLSWLRTAATALAITTVIAVTIISFPPKKTAQ
jgi:hypothetical protein